MTSIYSFEMCICFDYVRRTGLAKVHRQLHLQLMVYFLAKVHHQPVRCNHTFCILINILLLIHQYASMQCIYY